jgi:hypothetical protein
VGFGPSFTSSFEGSRAHLVRSTGLCNISGLTYGASRYVTPIEPINQIHLQRSSSQPRPPLRFGSQPGGSHQRDSVLLKSAATKSQ